MRRVRRWAGLRAIRRVTLLNAEGGAARPWSSPQASRPAGYFLPSFHKFNCLPLPFIAFHCLPLHSIVFYCIPFYSISFHFIPFPFHFRSVSVPFPFHSISVPFRSIALHSMAHLERVARRDLLGLPDDDAQLPLLGRRQRDLSKVEMVCCVRIGRLNDKEVTVAAPTGGGSLTFSAGQRAALSCGSTWARRETERETERERDRQRHNTAMTRRGGEAESSTFSLDVLAPRERAHAPRPRARLSRAASSTSAPRAGGARAASAAGATGRSGRSPRRPRRRRRHRAGATPRRTSGPRGRPVVWLVRRINGVVG